MFDKDFHADANQYQTAEKFHAQVKTFPEEDTDQAAGKREDKRGETDDEQRAKQLFYVVESRKSERDAYGQRINAGCHRHSEDHLQLGRVEAALFTVLEMFAYHADT